MLPDLQPGDCLLYFEHSLLDWAIAIKTWSNVAHVEIYIGDGVSVASRNWVGVNLYALRRTGLVYVLRPVSPLNLEAAKAWFKTVQGQRYDWLGLFCFTLAVKKGSPFEQFCSEFNTNWYRAAGLVPFAPTYSADRVAPAQFLQSPAFRIVYSAN